VTRPLDPATYWLGQAFRVVWHLGLYTAAQRLSPRLPPGLPPAGGWPDTRALLTDLADLLRRDWADIGAGRQPLPADLVPDPRRLLDQARLFFADLPAVVARRRRGVSQEPFSPATRGRYPRYWLQNFHFQSDGWTSERSAKLYDTQVETLFVGGADAMRRRLIAPLVTALAGRDRPLFVDVGTGTGRTIAFARAALPDLRAVGVDLSEAYLKRARANATGGGFLVAPGERLPFVDGVADAVASVFMFHELPAGARRRVLAEMARVLRPDGVALILDSIQFGDHPPYDALIRRFPVAFHEPYYLDWAGCDATELADAAGLRVVHTERAFFAKLLVLRPAP
jgi:ubiquinone/menaquinone biosynthesis C-methylase UbiE